MEKQQLVLPHFLWLMVQNVSIVVNVVEANVFPFVKAFAFTSQSQEGPCLG